MASENGEKAKEK